jgi:hypothetical protein
MKWLNANKNIPSTIRRSAPAPEPSPTIRRSTPTQEPAPTASWRLALADLDDGTALAVAEHVAATLARTPRASHDTVVAAACA